MEVDHEPLVVGPTKNLDVDLPINFNRRYTLSITIHQTLGSDVTFSSDDNPAGIRYFITGGSEMEGTFSVTDGPEASKLYIAITGAKLNAYYYYNIRSHPSGAFIGEARNFTTDSNGSYSVTTESGFAPNVQYNVEFIDYGEVLMNIVPITLAPPPPPPATFQGSAGVTDLQTGAIKINVAGADTGSSGYKFRIRVDGGPLGNDYSDIPLTEGMGEITVGGFTIGSTLVVVVSQVIDGPSVTLDALTLTAAPATFQGSVVLVDLYSGSVRVDLSNASLDGSYTYMILDGNGAPLGGDPTRDAGVLTVAANLTATSGPIGGFQVGQTITVKVTDSSNTTFATSPPITLADPPTQPGLVFTANPTWTVLNGVGVLSTGECRLDGQLIGSDSVLELVYGSTRRFPDAPGISNGVATFTFDPVIEMTDARLELTGASNTVSVPNPNVPVTGTFEVDLITNSSTATCVITLVYRDLMYAGVTYNGDVEVYDITSGTRVPVGSDTGSNGTINVTVTAAGTYTYVLGLKPGAGSTPSANTLTLAGGPYVINGSVVITAPNNHNNMSAELKFQKLYLEDATRTVNIALLGESGAVAPATADLTVPLLVSAAELASILTVTDTDSWAPKKDADGKYMPMADSEYPDLTFSVSAVASLTAAGTGHSAAWLARDIDSVCVMPSANIAGTDPKPTLEGLFNTLQFAFSDQTAGGLTLAQLESIPFEAVSKVASSAVSARPLQTVFADITQQGSTDGVDSTVTPDGEYVRSLFEQALGAGKWQSASASAGSSAGWLFSAGDSLSLYVKYSMVKTRTFKADAQDTLYTAGGSRVFTVAGTTVTIDDETGVTVVSDAKEYVVEFKLVCQ
jgi:hypothetical protein